MRMSTIVELLLILLLVAFAAYGRVIDRDEVNHRSIRAANNSRQIGLPSISLKQATDSVNRYCTCNENICNCCRDFHIPLVQLKGPGCASLQYLQGDNLAVQLSFGDNILTSAVVNGKSPKPVCVPLPGGFTKFCGRIYSIQRDAKNHFKACLGLELQSSTELEASLRVSCFRFGPDGLKLRPAEPLPVVEAEASEEEEDDDFFGLGGDDDDDDDDDEDEDAPSANSVTETAGDESEDDDDEDDDVLGLGALFDIFTGDDESSTKKPKVTTAPPLLEFTIPIINRPTPAPIEGHEPLTSGNTVPEVSDEETSVELSQEPEKLEEDEDINTENTDVQTEEAVDSTVEEAEDLVPETSNKIPNVVKPSKTANKVKATVVNKKKPTATSTSANAIQDGNKKKKQPLKKPHKDEDEDEDLLGEEDLDDDEEDDEILNDDDKDDLDDDDEDDDESHNENDDEKADDEKHEDEDDDEDEKAEEVEDLDDDDDEEEDEMISALVYDDKEKGKENKPSKDEESEEDDSDYSLGLSGLLARKRHARTGRQSRIMRL